MSERFTPPPSNREIDRIELDLAPFLVDHQDREEGAYEYSEFTKRINAELAKRSIYIALYDGTEPVSQPANDQGRRRVFDEEHINDAILEATRRRSVIGNAGARVIASQLHGGQASALYALSSSGAITDELLDEVQGAQTDERLDPMSRACGPRNSRRM